MAAVDTPRDGGPAHWLVVACAEHAARGQAGGFMQACHGKGAPMRRIRPGDGVVVYSPTRQMGGGPPLQAFTAIGTVRPGAPYQADMGGGFVPWRRDVAWRPAAQAAMAPIRPLLGQLSFTAGKDRWGAALRFGLLALTADDMVLIGQAMRDSASTGLALAQAA